VREVEAGDAASEVAADEAERPRAAAAR
jgi:hypothetical protein